MRRNAFSSLSYTGGSITLRVLCPRPVISHDGRRSRHSTSSRQQHGGRGRRQHQRPGASAGWSAAGHLRACTQRCHRGGRLESVLLVVPHERELCGAHGVGHPIGGSRHHAFAAAPSRNELARGLRPPQQRQLAHRVRLRDACTARDANGVRSSGNFQFGVSGAGFPFFPPLPETPAPDHGSHSTMHPPLPQLSMPPATPASTEQKVRSSRRCPPRRNSAFPFLHIPFI